MSFWRRKHRHDWETKALYSGAACTVQWQECECGEETPRELTPAGWQQFGWWVEIHPDWDTERIRNGIKYGLLPYPLVWTGAQPDGSLWRILTQAEVAELIGA